MKRLLLSIFTLICANTLLAQEIFSIGELTYEITNETQAQVELHKCSNSAISVIIPQEVSYNGVNYSVTAIGADAFKFCLSLASVNIPNSVTSIGENAFVGCINLNSIVLPSSITSIGNNAFTFCETLTSVTCLAEATPVIGSGIFNNTNANITLTVPFGATGYASNWAETSWKKINYLIQEGETKLLSTNFTINNKTGLINEGVLRIKQNGQLINKTSTNVGGIIEIETPTLANDKWSFIGAPFAGYKIKAVKPGSKDIAISLFDYTTGNWAEDFATIDDSVGSGEGFFAWSFAAEPTVFTTYGDGAETYNFETTPAYSLNNGAVNVTKNLTTHTEGGNWLALSNPYTFKLDVEKFLSEHGDIKGGEVYRFNGSVWTPVSEGEINMTEGFFVNFENPGTHSVSFSKFYIYEPAKSKAIEAKDYITLNVAEGENVSKLRFAQNPKAKQGDDIFDANKLFSPLEITEPYFVTDGVALVKEEVKELPYYATLNIKNYDSKEVTFRVDNIPEDVYVYLLDNGQDIKMNGGVKYTTNIAVGENEDRFKLLIKKARRIAEEITTDIYVHNSNRYVTITTTQKDLKIEVYNALGQKVFETKNYNFTLKGVSSGAYLIKAYNNTSSKTSKVIIR